MVYKFCSKCERERHETDFYANGPGTLRSECKDCTRENRKSESYKASQLAYDRSDKGRARHHRYNVSQSGRNRNENFYYDNRDSRLAVAQHHHRLRRMKRLGVEFKATNKPNYGSFFEMMPTDVDVSQILSGGYYSGTRVEWEQGRS